MSVCCEISSQQQQYANQDGPTLDCDNEPVLQLDQADNVVCGKITSLFFKLIKVNLKEPKRKEKARFESLSNIFLMGCFRSCCTASGMIRGLCWHFVSHSAINGVLLDWNNRIVSWFIHEREAWACTAALLSPSTGMKWGMLDSI